MSFIGCFALREFNRIRKHKGFLFLVLVWPLLYAFFFGRVYSDRVLTKLPVVIADEDRSQLSRTLVRYLEASRSFEIVRTVENPKQIEDLIVDNEAMVGIYIPRHLEDRIKRGQAERVIAFVNASNLSVGNQASADLQTVIGTVSAGIQLKFLKKSGSSTKRAMGLIQPVKVESARLHNPGFDYLNYVAPGIWASILHQLLVLFGALAFVREFELGREAEMWSLAQGKPWRLLVGKFLPYLLIGILLFSAYFSILFPVFNIPLPNVGWNVLIFSIPLVLAVLSYGFTISTLSDASTGALRGVLLLTSPAFSLSGFVWPIAAMPEPLQWLGKAIPLTPYLSGYRKLIQEGAPLESVAGECLHLLVLSLIAMLLAWYGLRRRKKELS